MSIVLENPTTEYLPLTVICGWCRMVIKQGASDTEISHGICPECIREYFEDLPPEETRRSESTPLESVKQG